MDWNLVRSFLAVAENGTLAAAAEALGASQPTVGRHIDALEGATGLTLFARGRHGMVLSEAGLSLVEEAKAMQAEADRFELKAAGRAQSVHGPVRITASEVVSTYILPPIIAAFGRTEPDIQIELVSSNSVENLLSRDADIAVRMFRPVQNDIIARKTGELGMGIYAHRSYLADHGEPVDVETFLQHRLIGMDRSTLILDGMSDLGIKADRNLFSVRTDDQVAYLELLKAGAGIGFAAHILVAANPDIKQVLPHVQIPALPIWLASHQELRTSQKIRRTMDYLHQTISILPLTGRAGRE
ncbi:MAG: LysR family transcriptional regulator [Alphaproteobacteria bacterium]|nr:LysR family transcriptional regulator [Alphaproteobacteria bacterium]